MHVSRRFTKTSTTLAAPRFTSGAMCNLAWLHLPAHTHVGSQFRMQSGGASIPPPLMPAKAGNPNEAAPPASGTGPAVKGGSQLSDVDVEHCIAWNVNLRDIIAANALLKQHSTGQHLTRPQQTMAKFLLAVGMPYYPPDDSVAPEDRVAEVIQYVATDPERLKRLLDHGDEVSGPDDQQGSMTLDRYIEANPNWAPKPGVFVFPRDTNKAIKPLMRLQTSGVGCLTALFVGRYYKQCLKNPTSPQPPATLDVTQYIRMHVRDEHLWEYLVEGTGFCPSEIVKSVFGDSFRTVPTADFYKSLQDSGPLLVSSFTLIENGAFHTGKAESRPSFGVRDLVGGKLPYGKEVHHAMLIGVRTDDSGKQHFLLQNWWPDLPFVEVDKTFWTASFGRAARLPDPKPLSSGEYPMVEGPVATTCADAKVSVPPPGP